MQVGSRWDPFLLALLCVRCSNKERIRARKGRRGSPSPLGRQVGSIIVVPAAAVAALHKAATERSRPVTEVTSRVRPVQLRALADTKTILLKKELVPRSSNYPGPEAHRFPRELGAKTLLRPGSKRPVLPQRHWCEFQWSPGKHPWSLLVLEVTVSRL